MKKSSPNSQFLRQKRLIELKLGEILYDITTAFYIYSIIFEVIYSTKFGNFIACFQFYIAEMWEFGSNCEF